MENLQSSISAIIEGRNEFLSRLEKDADNCWQYPNADDKFQELETKMIFTEQEISLFELLKMDVEKLITEYNDLLI